MRPSLKIETWNLLSELGRTKSLTQAAERLDMDLPAASRLVSSLEKELGVEILDRKRKPAQIVTKSLELFSEADRIARQYQRLLKTAESIKHQDTIKPKRILKVSLPANIDRSAYLNAFSNFERKHSGLRVEVLIDAGEDGLLMWLTSDIGLQKKASHGSQRDTTLRFSWRLAATFAGMELLRASKNFETIPFC